MKGGERFYVDKASREFLAKRGIELDNSRLPDQPTSDLESHDDDYRIRVYLGEDAPFIGPDGKLHFPISNGNGHK